jgi:hypothetical protein
MQGSRPTFGDAQAAGVQHSIPPEEVIMNKYHFINVVARVNKPRPGPSIDRVFVPLTLFLGVLLALLPADFKDYAGIPAATWEALALLVALISGVAAGVLFVIWGYCVVRFRQKSPEQIFDEVVEEMARDRARASGILVPIAPSPRIGPAFLERWQRLADAASRLNRDRPPEPK